MHPKLRKFLIENGLRADATEAEAWELYKQLQVDDVAYNGPERADQDPGGERSSEGRQQANRSAAGARQHSGDDNEPPSAAGMSSEEVRAMIAQETQRSRAIEDACAVAGLGVEEARSMIDRGLSIEQARSELFDTLQQRQQTIGAGASVGFQVGTEDRDKFRAAVVDGLAMRSGRRIEQPAAGANEFRGQRLPDIARECLERAGIRCRGMNPDQISSRALSPAGSSDFPLLMSNVANRNLQAAYTEAPSTYRQWVAVGDANDFKELHALKLSNSPDLEELDEHGEFKTADFSEAGETYKVITKGIKAKFTRVMLINDDLRAFTRIPTMIGTAAKRMENKMVYGLLLSNPAMNDGKTLFHADHKNLAAAGDIDAVTLGKARAAMRKQKGMAGETLDVTPAFLLAGTDEEMNADILLRSAALPDVNLSSGVHNPWAGKLTPVTDPLLDLSDGDDPFYLLAHPNQAPIIEVAWLLGNEQPFVDDEMEFGTGAITYVCRHDFGCGVVDHIGAYKIPRS
ncbi:phage major capsid protein [Desulfogranum japonicum]|uniref:phage major capsid protein n=1 Tax=Desulfogranum japonicum TaxID=231447 RepID=UPI0003F64C39|nr:hypothetical protein [Desulfogranum japonicum]